MRLETNKIIKGRVAETIAEEMFKELKFFVMKFGKEHTANPLDQIKNFVNICGGNFNLEKLDMEIREISHINILPDFILVNPNGKVQLLEVKFRFDAKPMVPRDLMVFKTYPEAHMLIINLSVSEDLWELKNKTEEEKEALKNSRFHIWTKKGEYKENGVSCEITTLQDWLKKDFNLEPELVKGIILEKYEKLVDNWLSNK